MIAYAIRRLFVAVPVIIVATFVTFLLVANSGDPLSALKTHHPPVPPSVIAEREHQLRLDQPLLERYWHWLTGVLHGDFGPSVQSANLDIGKEITHRLAVTFRLVFAAMILAALIAVVVGVISAVKQYSVTDYAFTFSGFLFLSLPVFWFAVLLKQAGITINTHAGHTIFYTIGESTVGLEGGWAAHFKDVAEHMILPTIVLAMTSYAAWSRYNRASMLEVLNSDYVRLARSKGISRNRVMVRHALRTALIPLVTVMALDLATILSGAVITETVFQWHGMGDFLLTSIRAKDTYAVLGWLVVVAAIVVLFNLIADLLYAVLDPRIRYE
ncbi:MAG: ABC transporter permease [Actinomycetes bacterium]